MHPCAHCTKPSTRALPITQIMLCDTCYLRVMEKRIRTSVREQARGYPNLTIIEDPRIDTTQLTQLIEHSLPEHRNGTIKALLLPQEAVAITLIRLLRGDTTARKLLEDLARKRLILPLAALSREELTSALEIAFDNPQPIEIRYDEQEQRIDRALSTLHARNRDVYSGLSRSFLKLAHRHESI